MFVFVSQHTLTFQLRLRHYNTPTGNLSSSLSSRLLYRPYCCLQCFRSSNADVYADSCGSSTGSCTTAKSRVRRPPSLAATLPAARCLRARWYATVSDCRQVWSQLLHLVPRARFFPCPSLCCLPVAPAHGCYRTNRGSRLCSTSSLGVGRTSFKLMARFVGCAYLLARSCSDFIERRPL